MSGLLKNSLNSLAKLICAGLAIGGVLFPTLSQAGAATTEAPNVVVIFADDLGYGDLSCYGATKLSTPNIDRLASEGRRFTDAHSASAVCTPSRYGLMTGRYPFRKGLSKPVFLRTGLVVDPDRTTVADVMKNAGYATACIGKWHLGFGEKTPDWNGALKPGPLEVGFDYYYGVPTVNSHPPFVYVENHHVVGLVPEDPFVYGETAKTQIIEEKMIRDIGGADAAHALYDDYAVGTRLAGKSVEWIEENKEKPFFLYLATTNIHHPFTPAKRFQGTSECGLYGDFVHELDWIVGEVMATLEKNGLAENTLVIFTSDNGGMINVTGQKAIKQGHNLNGELLGFKFDGWEGGHRVPFIARWPGKVEANSVSDQLISNVDLLGTMAALTGQSLKADEGPDSFNVLPALTGSPKAAIRNHLVMGASKATHLVFRDGDWVMIGGKGGGGFGSPQVGSHGFGGPAALKFAGQTNSDVVDGKLKKDAPAAQLYNLSADLAQGTNVIQKYPERAASMRAQLNKIKASSATRPGVDQGVSTEASATSALRPNIVFMMIDDLGAEAVGNYGGESYQTPHMDKLATQGMKFENAFAMPMCMIARATLMSGRYGFRSGLPSNIDPVARTGDGWGKDEITVANLLQNAGYTTAISGKWHLCQFDRHPDHLTKKGFEYQNAWAWIIGEERTRRYWESTYYREKELITDGPGVYGPDELCRYAMDFMEAHKDSEKPFFLYYPMVGVHSPWPQTPDNIDVPQRGWSPEDNLRIPETQKWSQPNFKAMIEYSDKLVGRVAAKIEGLGIAENTLLIVTADNGTFKRASSRFNGEMLNGGKGSTFDIGTRVPFFAVWKGKIVEGSINQNLIDFTDILPTLVELGGGERPLDRILDGQSFLGQLLGEKDAPARDWVFACNGDKRSVRGKNYSLNERGQLFDLTRNRYEPELLNKGALTTEQRTEFRRLSDVMVSLEYPGSQADALRKGGRAAKGKGLPRLRSGSQAPGAKPKGTAETAAGGIKAKSREKAPPTQSTPETVTPSAGRKFRTLQLADGFHAESAALADIDNDGDEDVVYGPFWFAGPNFKKRHPIYPPNPFEVGTYSNNFFSYADDIDKDGWTDVLVLGFPRRAASTYWFKNPGAEGHGKPWEKFVVFEGVGNESPVWADVTGDGEKEVLCSMNGQFGLVAPADRSKPELAWGFTPISPPKSTGSKFTHGLGFGDVNGDGRNDLLERTGWWEQPYSDGGDEFWTKHPYVFSEEKGGSQMFAYDFDGDGDNDIVSAINAHGYGLAWFEQVAADGFSISFVRHLIMGTTPEESRYGLAFSQLHGLRLDDIDGDGVLDIVTGKRYFAHGGKDPGGKDIPVLYWFQTVRGENPVVDFVPHLIHDASGVGVDVVTGDANGDGRIDVVVGNKKGCFVHLQTDEEIAAPKPVMPIEKSSEVPAIAGGASEGLLFEGESMKVLKRAGSLRRQNVKRPGGGKWSGDAQLWWTGSKPGDVIELSLPVDHAGRYRIGVGLTKARDYGIVEFALDGKKLGDPTDLFNPAVIHTGTITLGGEQEFEAGEHILSVTLTGTNPEALKKYMFGLDYVHLFSGEEAGWTPLEPGGSAPGKVSAKKPKAGPVVAEPSQTVKEGNDLETEARSAEEQLASFTLPEGFEIELVASEEHGVAKPTSIAFDDAGRLWATTALEYPRDQDPEVWKNPGRDRVVIIDRPHLRKPQPVRTFADGLIMPMSVLPIDGGAIVAQGPEIFFLDDKNGDGKADERKVLLTGFGVQDTHTLPHQLSRSPGGRITFSQGVLNTGVITDADGRSHEFHKTLVASMTPEGRDFRIIGAGMNNIWAWAQSRVGRVFIHEANDKGFGLAQFVEDSSYPSFRFSKIHPEAPLHPMTAEGLDLGGTGFSGIAICDDRSGSFPAAWKDRFLVANPIFGKINAASGVLGSDDVWSFSKEGDLVSCSDPMFRPVCIAFGPDGCLYIADWYNRIISHNEVARDHPARDKEHGRIWRVRHVNQPKASITDFSQLPTDQLPAALDAESTWAMRAAWHQMAERQDASLVPELVAMLSDDKTPDDVRIHALWSLEELGHFDVKLWAKVLSSSSADLRREAVRALNTLMVPQAKAAPLLAKLANDMAWNVRYEVLRYFRRAEGPVSPENLAWLREWSGTKASGQAEKDESLALDGSYQKAFQDFLLMLAETKTQLPVTIPTKWGGVIEKNSHLTDPKAVKKRIAAVKLALPEADLEIGRLMTESICLTCHSIGGKGVGFSPPLDGSANRDLDGMITAIVDPNAAIENVFRSFRIETKDGTIQEGFNRGENRAAITLLSMGGARQVVPIKSIKSAGYIEGKSVMPDLSGGMTPEQIAGIVAYLRSVN